MLLTSMPAQDYARWGFNLAQARLAKSVLAEMKAINTQTIQWFNRAANKNDWVLKKSR